MSGRILIVEPYAAIRELVAAALRRSAHDIAAAADGNEAVAAMEREHFRCVIVGSPVVVKSGDEKILFLEYIERHCPRWRPCLVVVTTHVEEGEIATASERLRVCAVLAKPFGAQDLLRLVDACLAGSHRPTRWIGVAEPYAAPAAAERATPPGLSR